MINNAFEQRNNLTQSEFDDFRRFLEDACGITLGDNKQYLVSTRVRRILADNKLQSVAELVTLLKNGRQPRLRQTVIDAMTTNETFWFRDNYPYEYLKSTLLPELCNAGSGPIKVWSAACSSGQEPYSISMIVDEFSQQRSVNFRRTVDITATDLSSEILDHAKRGEYDKMSVLRGLSPERLRTFFDEVDGNTWRLKAPIKQRVQFRSMNLMDSYMALGKLDIVFCRNVLIYFSPDLKRDILRKIHGTLKPGGILFLGSSEGLGGAADLFEMTSCNPGILYRAIK